MATAGSKSGDMNGTGDIVLVHSSDIHVDTESTARAYGGDGNMGLRLVLEAAQNLAADVVLLAGDTFEHNRLPLSILDQTTRILGDSGLEIVILPGNHDPANGGDAPYDRGGVADPENVHVLGVTQQAAIDFDQFDLEVWGHAHTSYADMEPLRAPRMKEARWHIAMAHGHYTPVPDRAVRNKPSWLFGDDEIAATGADYVALGHWNTAVKVGDGAVPAYYSGSPNLEKTVNEVRLAADGSVTVSRQPIRWEKSFSTS